MSASVVGGPIDWKLTRSEDGHRTYTIRWRVECSTNDGPFVVLNATGLPLPGTEWDIGNDYDPWAFCLPTAKVEKQQAIAEGHPAEYYVVEQTFSTKQPDVTKQRCSEIPVEDPLLEPAKVSGSFQKYTEEATSDRFGNPLLSSSHEQLRGPTVEFDANRATIKIEQNVATPEQGYELPTSMIDTLNNAPLWGQNPRCIKLSAAPWERKFYGRCNVYFTRTLEFEIREDGFDRGILDEGTKLLHGHWDETTGAWILDNIDGAAPNADNATHFDRATDKNGNPIRVVLNGEGLPAESTIAYNNYVCILATTGNPVINPTYWIPIIPVTGTTITTPPAWSAFSSYVRGNLVTYLSSTYVALDNSDPSEVSLPDSSPTFWKNLTPGLVNRGTYSDATAYVVGNYVVSPETTVAATIHVEKYNESNFLLLGIPTDFLIP